MKPERSKLKTYPIALHASPDSPHSLLIQFALVPPWTQDVQHEHIVSPESQKLEQVPLLLPKPELHPRAAYENT